MDLTIGTESWIARDLPHHPTRDLASDEGTAGDAEEFGNGPCPDSEHSSGIAAADHAGNDSKHSDELADAGRDHAPDWTAMAVVALPLLVVILWLRW